MHFTPIIERRGVEKLADVLGIPTKNVRRWVDNDSIPGEWWKPIADRRVASLTELAAAAQARRLAKRSKPTPRKPQPQGEAA